MIKKMIIIFISMLFLFTLIPINASAVDPIEYNEELINERRFLWKAPSTPAPDGGYPVIFVLHGAYCYPESWFWAGKGLYKGARYWGKRQTEFVAAALERGFVIIAPDSVSPHGAKAWDSFTESYEESVDLSFFQGILEWLEDAPIQVNMSRLYCTGLSSGGAMTSRVAHYFGTQFKAVAIHSGMNANANPYFWKYDYSSPYNFSSDHPPTLIIQGGRDRLVPAESAIHFYHELRRNKIESKLLYERDAGHIWLSKFNEDILDWFSGIRTPFIMITRPEGAIYINDIIKPPFSNIFYPFPTSLVVGGLTILVYVSNTSKVDRVEFFIDDELKYVDDTEPLYWWHWDEQLLGRHTIKAVCYDHFENKVVDEVDVFKLK